MQKLQKLQNGNDNTLYPDLPDFGLFRERRNNTSEQNISDFSFIYLKTELYIQFYIIHTYLVGKRERKKREKEIVHLQVCSLSVLKSWGWARA